VVVAASRRCCEGGEQRVLSGGDINSPQIRARSEVLYAGFPALAERRRALAGSLSGGQHKMLGVAKALAGNPVLF
jgi:branched-chain amino acid transport system ATP-binding protein